MYFSLLVFIFLIKSLLPVGETANDEVSASKCENEIVHWILYEASKENNASIALEYLIDNRIYVADKKELKQIYIKNENLNINNFFDNIIYKNSCESLFIYYYNDLDDDQIESFLSSYDINNKNYDLLNIINNDREEEVYLDIDYLNLGILHLDHPNYFYEYKNQIINLYEIWKKNIDDFHELENSVYSHFFARFFYNIDDIDLTIEVYDKGYLKYISFKDYSIGTYSFIISSLQNKGKFDALIKLFRSDLLPNIGEEKFGSIGRIVEIYLNYAITLHNIGNVNISLEALNEIPLYVDIEQLNPSHYFAYVNNRSVFYHELGRYNEYVDLQLEALEYARELDISDAKLHSLNNLFRYYRSIDNWQQAESYLQQAIAIAEQSDSDRHAENVQSMAIYQRDYLHNYEEASSYFEQALQEANRSEEFEIITRVKTEWADLHRQQESYSKAADLHAEVIDQSRELGSERTYIDGITRYAEIQMDKGNLSEAYEFLQKTDEYDLREFDFRLQLRTKNAYARYHLLNNEPQKAFEIHEPFVEETLGRVQNSSDYQTGRASLISVFEDAFQLYAAILSDMEDHHHLLSYLDRLNNLSQADFHNHHLLKSEMLSEDELIYNQELTQHINQIREQIRRTDDDREIAQLNEMLLEAENEKNRLRHKIHDQQQFDSPDITRIQRSLGRDEMVLKYSMLDGRMYIHAIFRDKIKARNVVFEPQEIEEIESKIEHLHNGETDLEFLYTLQSKLIDPEWVSDVSKIQVIPDHFVHYIPHEILPVSEPSHARAFGSTKYLIENVTINYRHSLNELLQSAPVSQQHNNGILAFGVTRTADEVSVLETGSELPSLPFASVEVNNIRQIYDDYQACEVFTDEQASYSNFINHAPQSKVLHLATHGEVSPHDPLFSVIYLGGDGNEDQSHIYAYELFEMNLQNELVVLSSCESGSGTYVKGGGIAGLSRAFRFAGVRSMALNLWPVRDETASRINTDFYNNMNKGYAKDEALREAKLSYLNTRNSDPFWWGAMMMYGDPSALHSEPGSKQIAYFILGFWILAMASIVIITNSHYRFRFSGDKITYSFKSELERIRAQ